MPGLTPGEQAVMTLFELGYSASDIACELSISTARAAAIISTYDDNPANDRHREALIRNGSRRLLKRLQSAGGHR
jgi:hypothetical protein